MEILNSKQLFMLCALRQGKEIKAKSQEAHVFTIKHWKYVCNKLIDLGFEPGSDKYKEEYKKIKQVALDTMESEDPVERIFHIKDDILPTLCDSNEMTWYSPFCEELEYNYCGRFVFEGELSNIERALLKKMFNS